MDKYYKILKSFVFNDNRFKRGFVAGLRRFLIIGVLSIIYLILSATNIIYGSFLDNINLVLGFLLFILGMPLSVIFQVDILSTSTNVNNTNVLLAIAMFIAWVNFAFLGVILGWGKDKRKD